MSTNPSPGVGRFLELWKPLALLVLLIKAVQVMGPNPWLTILIVATVIYFLCSLVSIWLDDGEPPFPEP